MTTKSYNGHKNYNFWNVSLWINNDESLYREALLCIKDYGNNNDAAENMVRILEDIGITHTPDGVKYSKSAIRAAMVDM
ncbi:hypothetical protein [Pseudomonas phage vB_PsaM_M1]|nr:hypothetical protein [Pseudomonas phage vB_PsaM_M1]